MFRSWPAILWCARLPAVALACLRRTEALGFGLGAQQPSVS